MMTVYEVFGQVQQKIQTIPDQYSIYSTQIDLLSETVKPQPAATEQSIQLLRDGPACFDTTQPPAYEPRFQRTYGGTENENISQIITSPDGGFVCIGSSKSCYPTDDDIYLLKLDSCGNRQWARSFGNSGNDWGNIAATDDGYMIAGGSAITGRGYDILVVKTDLLGNIIWEKTYGGTGNEWSVAIIRNRSGDYLITGYINSYGAGGWDIFAMKIDGDGNVRMWRTYGTSTTDYPGWIIEEPDGSYAIAGCTYNPSQYTHDGLLIKTDSLGNMLWARRYQTPNNEGCYEVKKASNGDYFLIGDTKTTISSFDSDVLVLRIDSTGSLLWAKTYNSFLSGNSYEFVWTASLLSDDALVIQGEWGGSDFMIGSKCFILKTDNMGNPQWCRLYGSDGATSFSQSIVTTPDGGFCIGGSTNNPSYGGFDSYVIKTDSNGIADTAGQLVYPIVDVPSFSVSDPGLTTYSLFPDPNFKLNKSSLNYEDIPIGGSSTKSVTVTNSGLMNPLLITGITSIEGYTIVPNPYVPFPITIAPRASYYFDVTFAPTSFGTFNGDIVFEHNAVNSPTALPVSGNGVYPPIITVSPDSLNAELDIGQTTTRTITISNTGASDLKFNASIEFEGTLGIKNSYAKKTSESLQMKRVMPAGAQYKSDRVIVKFKDGVFSNQSMAIRSALQATVKKKFPSIRAELWLLSGVSVADAIAQYGNHPSIEYMEPDYIVHTLDRIPNDPMFSQLWGMQKIAAPAAWDRTVGTNIVVGDIDTGIDPAHEDLAANLWTNPGEIPGNSIDDDGNGYIDDIHGWDFCNSDNDPYDDHGHGTHTAGTIAAVGNNGVGVVGVCWSARIMALKFLNAGGYGNTSDAVSALEYAAMMQVKLTSNSWGGGSYSQALYDAIAAAGDAGSLFIAAAGNDGMNTDAYPNYPSCYNLNNIISVASTTSSDDRSSFSNYGLVTVDLGAPGSDVYSTLPGNTYASKNGTSMATPHVSGAAALVLSLNPIMSWAEVKNIILSSVDPIPSLAGKTVTGGRLNVARAAQMTQTWITMNPTSGIVSPGGSADLTVTFDATEVGAGSYRSMIVINSNDPVEPVKVLPAALQVIGNQIIIQAEEYWNLVSVPLIQSNDSAHVVFPGKNDDMYSYNTSTGTYDVAPTLIGGAGYWVNYLSATAITINGSLPGSTATTAAKAGWVLVGSRDTAVAISSLELSDGALITGNAYRYNPVSNEYETTPVINPGKGVWINVSKACTITFP